MHKVLSSLFLILKNNCEYLMCKEWFVVCTFNCYKSVEDAQNAVISVLNAKRKETKEKGNKNGSNSDAES